MKIQTTNYNTSFNGLNTRNVTKVVKTTSKIVTDATKSNAREMIKKTLPILGALAATGQILNKNQTKDEQELPFVEEPIICCAYGLDNQDTEALKTAKEFIEQAKKLKIITEVNTLENDIDYAVKNIDMKTGSFTVKNLNIIKNSTQSLKSKIESVNFGSRKGIGSLEPVEAPTDSVMEQDPQDFETLASPSKMLEFDDAISGNESSLENFAKELPDTTEDAVQMLGAARGIYLMAKGVINKDSRVTIKGAACLFDNTFMLPIKKIVIGLASEISGKIGGAIGNFVKPGEGIIAGGAAGGILGGFGAGILWGKSRDKIVDAIINYIDTHGSGGGSCCLIGRYNDGDDRSGSSGNGAKSVTYGEIRNVIFEEMKRQILEEISKLKPEVNLTELTSKLNIKYGQLNTRWDNMEKIMIEQKNCPDIFKLKHAEIFKMREDARKLEVRKLEKQANGGFLLNMLSKIAENYDPSANPLSKLLDPNKDKYLR